MANGNWQPSSTVLLVLLAGIILWTLGILTVVFS